jgi:hypothetical protein
MQNAAYARNSTRQQQQQQTQWGGIIFMLHRLFSPSNLHLHTSSSTSFENASVKVLKAPTSKATKTRQDKNSFLLPTALQAHQRRQSSLGLVAFQREIVERARSRAHARSGGFGLDLRRLFCHDGHFLVDDDAA